MREERSGWNVMFAIEQNRARIVFPAPGSGNHDLVTPYRPRNDACSTTFEVSVHPEKIALANFDAVVAEKAMGDRSVEIEVRKRKAVEEFLTLERDGPLRPCRKSNVAAVGAFELRRRELLQIVAGLGQPLPQLLEGLFRVRHRLHLDVG